MILILILILILKVAKKYEQAKKKCKGKRAVLAAGVRPPRCRVLGKRRDWNTVIKGFDSTTVRRSTKEKTELEKYVKFDFVERYQGLGFTVDEANDKWRLARIGKFPPWAPCTSRRQPAVFKLVPEKVSRSKGVINDEVKPLPKRRFGRFPTGRKADIDLADCLDAPSAAVEEDEALDDRVLEPAPAKEEPPAKRRRVIPSTFRDAVSEQPAVAAADGLDPRLGQRLFSGSGARRALAISSATATIEPSKAGVRSPRPAKLAVVAPEKLTAEQLNAIAEELDLLPDYISDPVMFTKCIESWKRLTNGTIALLKV